MKSLWFSCTFFCILFLLTLSKLCRSQVVDPNWESIDSRPLPSWYDDGKIGIFIHWGVYSVPSYINAWIRDGSQAHDDFMKANFRPGFSYEVEQNK